MPIQKQQKKHFILIAEFVCFDFHKVAIIYRFKLEQEGGARCAGKFLASAEVFIILALLARKE